MSYSIIYDKQFIKIEDKYLPIVLSGDSNLYEGYGKSERRVRNFHTLVHNRGEKFLYTKDELIDFCSNHRKDLIKNSNDYEDKNFGFHSGIAIGGRSTLNTTYGNYKGIFVDGCKKALTIEQLNSYPSNINVSLRSYTGTFFKYASNTNEVKKIIQDALDWEKEHNETVYVSVSICENNLKWIKRHFFPKKKKNNINLKDGDVYYLLSYNNPKESKQYYYFKRFIKYGFKGSAYASGGNKFLNKKIAINQEKKLLDKFPSYNTIIEKIIV